MLCPLIPKVWNGGVREGHTGWVTSSVQNSAVVFGAGGVTGIAWAFGLVAALAERGIDLTQARVFSSTSAGAVVAAELAAGADPLQRLEIELAGPGNEQAPNAEIEPERRKSIIAARLPHACPAESVHDSASAQKAQISKNSISARKTLGTLGGGSPLSQWTRNGPRLQVVVVDEEAHEALVLGEQSAVALSDAITASCAVPGYWPAHQLPLAMGNAPAHRQQVLTKAHELRRFVDGGLRSVANRDLVDFAPLEVGEAAYRRTTEGRMAAWTGAEDPVEHIILITPMRPPRAELADPRIVARLHPTGLSARIMRRGPLDPQQRAAAAEAGVMQGKTVSDELLAAMDSVLGSH